MSHAGEPGSNQPIGFDSAPAPPNIAVALKKTGFGLEK
jgi:hypothetical protein